MNNKEKDKVIEELVAQLDEEYLKGAKSSVNFLREEGIICKPQDKCGECNKINKFLRDLEKRLDTSKPSRTSVEDKK